MSRGPRHTNAARVSYLQSRAAKHAGRDRLNRQLAALHRAPAAAHDETLVGITVKTRLVRKVADIVDADPKL